ncbi:lasso RiPP family leader peptide-containing protein [Streptomyces huasconensis]
MEEHALEHELYETPILMEVGEFSEDTLGSFGTIWDSSTIFNA